MIVSNVKNTSASETVSHAALERKRHACCKNWQEVTPDSECILQIGPVFHTSVKFVRLTTSFRCIGYSRRLFSRQVSCASCGLWHWRAHILKISALNHELLCGNPRNERRLDIIWQTLQLRPPTIKRYIASFILGNNKHDRPNRELKLPD